MVSCEVDTKSSATGREYSLKYVQEQTIQITVIEYSRTRAALCERKDSRESDASAYHLCSLGYFRCSGCCRAVILSPGN